MDTTSKYVKTYDPERDAPRHEKFNEHLFEVVPKSTVSFAGQQVTEHFAKNVDPESYTALCQAFEVLLEKFPILSRIIVYTYSPAEDLDTRTKMLDLWDKTDEIRNDLRTHRIIYEARFCCSIPAHPDAAISQFPVISEFLENYLPHDFKCTLDNDIRKLCGEEGTIKELRDNWFMTEERAGNKHTWFNCSPLYKIEFIEKKFGDAEIYVRLINDPAEMESLFLYADAQVVESFQLSRRLPDRLKVFIYGPDGNLVEAPGKHTNPFSFNPLEKYDGLIKKEAYRNKWQIEPDIEYKPVQDSDISRKDPQLIAAKSQATIAFYKSMQEWTGNIPPAAHFNTLLPWRLEDLLKKEFRAQEKTAPLETEYERFLLNKEFDPVEAEKQEDLLKRKSIYEENERQEFESSQPHYLDNLDKKIYQQHILQDKLQKTENPIEVIILENLLAYINGEEPPLETSQLGIRLQKRTGRKMTDRGINSARERIRQSLKNIINT